LVSSNSSYSRFVSCTLKYVSSFSLSSTNLSYLTTSKNNVEYIIKENNICKA
jgi:hypothetical protein